MFCQNDSIPNSGFNLNWIESPENFIDSVQYDDDSDLIFITKFIGGHTMSLPRYFSVEEYRKYLFKQKFNNY